MAKYELTQAIPTDIQPGDILHCSYSGKVISITLPKGVYDLECHGAGHNYEYTGAVLGGKSTGRLTLEKETTLHLQVGGQGDRDQAGYNGGGGGTFGNDSYNGSGGTDIRVNTDSLYARVLVAGGVGGSNIYYIVGGAGGGNEGAAGAIEEPGGWDYGTSASAPGTQTSGGKGGTCTHVGYPTYQGEAGSFGKGGNGAADGGGGGGWYGGGGGSASVSSSQSTAGSGGSGYTYSEDTQGSYPPGCLLDQTHYLQNTTNVLAGARTYTGEISITVVEIQRVEISTKIEEIWRETEAAYHKGADGIWREILSVQPKVSGIWRES